MEEYDFDITSGPLSLEIMCGNMNTARLRHRTSDVPVGTLAPDGFATYGGWGTIPVLVVNSQAPDTAAVQAHERQHLRQRLLDAVPVVPRKYDIDFERPFVKDLLVHLRRRIFRKQFNVEEHYERNLFQKLRRNPSDREQHTAFMQYLYYHRQRALWRAKDEILAQYQGFLDHENRSIAQEIAPDDSISVNNLSDIFAPGHHYDYLASLRDRITKRLPEQIQTEATTILETEYLRVIEDGIQVFRKLLGFTGGAEAIRLLSLVDITSWPTEVRRLVQHY